MAFTLFTPLFNKIDTTTASFVTDISSNAIAAITPAVTVGLTLAFITFAVFVAIYIVVVLSLRFAGLAPVFVLALIGGDFADRANRRLQSLIDRSRILVLASHSDDLIRAWCTRAALLENGQLVEIGPVDEVLAAYHARNQARVGQA